MHSPPSFFCKLTYARSHAHVDIQPLIMYMYHVQLQIRIRIHFFIFLKLFSEFIICMYIYIRISWSNFDHAYDRKYVAIDAMYCFCITFDIYACYNFEVEMRRSEWFKNSMLLEVLLDALNRMSLVCVRAMWAECELIVGHRYDNDDQQIYKIMWMWV